MRIKIPQKRPDYLDRKAQTFYKREEPKPSEEKNPVATPVETIIAATELLTDPKRFTRKVYARTASGRPTTPTDPNATCFCTVGALVVASRVRMARRVPVDVLEPIAKAAVEKDASLSLPLAGRTGYQAVDERMRLEGVVITFTDEHTHREVIDVLVRAREIAEANETEKKGA